MYCSHCGRDMHYENLEHDGYCENCGSVVQVSPCKVSFWTLLAVFTCAWTLTIGA
jgi:hypothetical protein